MLLSWHYAHAIYDPDQLKSLDIDSLSLATCAILGRLSGGAAGAKLPRKQIANRLVAALQGQELKTGDIGLMALVIDGLHVCAPDRLDIDSTLLLIRRLIANEARVGGPYYSIEGGTDIDPVANACVIQCLIWLAAPPPSVVAFLTRTVADLEAVDGYDLALYVALQQSDAESKSVVGRQLLADMSKLTALLSLDVMRSSEAHLDDRQSVVLAMARDIHAHCLRSLPQFEEPFNAFTRSAIEQLIRVDTNYEISQLAWYYGSAIADKTLAKAVASKHMMYVNLGTANMFAWTAYTIYDDFLDNEGQPTKLATANYTFRAMVRQYKLALPNDEQFQGFVERCLVQVDQANALETAHYRMPVSSNLLSFTQLPNFAEGAMLADRALFHILGPMAVLALTGKAQVGDELWEHTLQGFRHYLIARQLNDDIHDWVKDLRAGQASYVVVELFRYLNITPGIYNLNQLLSYSREQFWRHVLPQVCDSALAHIAQARRHLRDGLQLTDENEITNLFDYVENSVRAAQRQRRQSQALSQMF